MTRTLATTTWVLVAVLASFAQYPQLTWREVSRPDGMLPACRVSHIAAINGPMERFGYSLAGTYTGRGLHILSVQLLHSHRATADRVWLYWRLFAAGDLEHPIAEQHGIPTRFASLTTNVGQTDRVDIIIEPPSADMGQTYRVEFGVERVDWNDGTRWLCPTHEAPEPQSATQLQHAPEPAQPSSVDPVRAVAPAR